MVNDVTAVMMKDFANNMQARLDAYERGVSPGAAGTAKSASGFSIGIQAAWMALKRVWGRFFLPYDPQRV
jgi:hypothetical protein